MGRKTMSGDDGFLARWSRRKRVSAAQKRDSARPKSAIVATDDVRPDIPTASLGRDASDAIAVPPSLPPIESLDAASDITPFLAPGVPAELTRQALRRAWAADPVIRDFIGLSENAWDFNAPDGVPGFGALTQEDVRRLLDSVTGKPGALDSPPEASAPGAAETPPAPIGNAVSPAQTHDPHMAKTGAGTATVAAQPDADQQKRRNPLPGRHHGGALPR
jgi:hypothetical protein